MTILTTTNGGKFNLTDPKPEQVFLDDIAHGLASQNRFIGRTRPCWSVAQHSLLCAELAGVMHQDPGLVMAALLHDAHEAYIGDIATPVVQAIDKLHPGTASVLHDMKCLLDDTIFDALDVPEAAFYLGTETLKRIDAIALSVEKNLLLDTKDSWPCDRVWSEITPAQFAAVGKLMPGTVQTALNLNFDEQVMKFIDRFNRLSLVLSDTREAA
ncbi:MAG: hypothetical protein ING36_02970 [Burkholderiales bacterium]|nr:hypothetical protein [Burkholderiales bacterium]